MKFVILALCVYLSQPAVVPGNDVLAKPNTQQIPQFLKDEELVNYINKNQQLWEAHLVPESHGLKYKMMHSRFRDQSKTHMLEEANDPDTDIPESFDSRTQWPECPSLRYIRDQANCGSCWAFSSAEAMSDRACIATKGKIKVEISADDILSCCTECGFGCDGGWPLNAFQYFADEGVVSGGNYGTKDACKPYEIHPCGYHVNQTYYGECNEEAATPKCRRRCQRGFRKAYRKDKVYGKDAFRLPNSEKAIQKEIMKNGPVVASFAVYQDFMMYNKGIYKHIYGGEMGYHAVKIIGWGKEDVPYWIIANSWNSDWGEDGYFRIVRGANECEIEESVVAGHVSSD